MVNFYDLLVAGGLFTSFITSILLFTRGGYQLHANRLLGTVIFSWGWYVLLYLFIVTGWLNFVPWIYRIGSPLYYLIPGCSFLYVRSILLDETKFRKYDWLHLIPALFYAIDLMPFYFSDMENKRAVAYAITNNFTQSYQLGTGFIPAFWHFQFRWILGVIYLIFQWQLLIQVFKRDKLEAFKEVKGWLLTFTIFCTVIYVGLGSMSIFAWINLKSGINPLSSARSIPTLLQVIGFVCLSVYLFFKPEVLYGIPRSLYTLAGNPLPQVQSSSTDAAIETVDETDTAQVPREAPFNQELMLVYVSQLEAYMHKEAPFRQQGFVITELASALKMPLHHLSYVLNHHYKHRFTDFINSFRIEYVKTRMESGDWRSLTLEGLAKESGFSSRSTFSVAFKKFTGVTPSQYLQLKEKN